MKLFTVSPDKSNDWFSHYSTDNQSHAIKAIESGNILVLPTLPFILLPHETEFLSSTHVDTKSKNISYNINAGLLRGTKYTGFKYAQLRLMLDRFSQASMALIKNLLPAYHNHLQLGRTSFRPVEISGRTSSYRKDDTRLHVDAFPATPNQGRRILRVFSNINPNGQDRVWRMGEPFEQVAKYFLPKVSARWPLSASLLKLLKLTKSYRTEYDHIMLQIHDRMKADLSYQKNVSQRELRFSPGTSWIVQTDDVSHAAMSGQFVLEQTFYLPVEAMMNPEYSPLRILERLTGKKLVSL